MSNPQITPIEYSSEQITKIVLTNIVKMMSSRGLISPDKLNDKINELINTNSLDNIYSIALDNPIINESDPYFNGSILHIALIDQKITTLNKAHPMMKFINQNKHNQKLLVMKTINEKSKYLLKQNNNTEIFSEINLMDDLINWLGMPTHIPLSQKEGENVMNEYMATKSNMSKILDTEPAACYFNLRPGQVVKILRSDFTIFYRMTVKNNVLAEN
jgi:DNA-directed RNA polymerase subunit H (RpoH/RPB5)